MSGLNVLPYGTQSLTQALLCRPDRALDVFARLDHPLPRYQAPSISNWERSGGSRCQHDVVQSKYWVRFRKMANVLKASKVSAGHSINCKEQRGFNCTFVPDHPSLNAASCANSSPNPSINPLTKGSSRFIAAPRSRPHIVGGEYSIMGDLDDEGGEGESSLFEEE